MDLKELENGVQPEKHWYYQSKKQPLLHYTRLLLRKVPKLTIVDVGSGSGFFARELEKEFGDRIEKVWLVDINYTPEEIAETKDQKIEKALFIPEKMNHALVVLMDVLEHLADDLDMLASIRRACEGGENYYFITVPAFQSLWSGHDDYLGHYRRYKIPMLRNVVKQAGFKSGKFFYLYGALFPLVWLVRRINNLRKKEASSNMAPASPMVNASLLALNTAEMKVARGNKLFGVTCCSEGRIS